jgi:release factor glutamine methyltransferase
VGEKPVEVSGSQAGLASGAGALPRRLALRQAVAVTSGALSASTRLAPETPILAEAEQLVQAAYRAATGKTLGRSELYLRGDEEFPASGLGLLMRMTQERVDGKLLQHCTGFQFFWQREYEVSPEALVPRPETEVLLREALPRARGASLGLEVGVGSGILSIELLLADPGLVMLATDVSAPALALAARNARTFLGKDWDRRLTLVQCSADAVLAPFFPLLSGRRADFLISNPPYLLRSAEETQPEVARQEPPLALFAPEGDPLFFYREIAGVRSSSSGGGSESPGLSNNPPFSRVFLELPHERAEVIHALFAREGWRAELIQDLTGRPRVLIGEKIPPEREGEARCRT